MAETFQQQGTSDRLYDQQEDHLDDAKQDEEEASKEGGKRLLLELLDDCNENSSSSADLIISELNAFLTGLKAKRESIDKFNAYALNTLTSLKTGMQSSTRLPNNLPSAASSTSSSAIPASFANIHASDVMPVGLAADLAKLHSILTAAIKKLKLSASY